jgi:hypothetical protein
MSKFVLVAGFCALVALFVGVPVSSATRAPGLNCNTDATVCQFSFSFPYGPVDTNLACGSGASAFEIFDQGVEIHVGTVWFDRNGNVTNINDHFVVTDAMWSNPLTGDVVPYTQNNIVNAVLAVPGDFSTEIDTVTGENIYRTASGTGKWLLHSTGRQVFAAPFGNATTIISSTPNNPFTEAALGDTTVFNQVCAALGA